MSPTWLRWHSVLGAVPLAGYLLLHLSGQALSLRGSAPQRGDLPERSLWLLVLVVVLVYLPLAAHAALGLWRMAPRVAPAGGDALRDDNWPVPWGGGLQRSSALGLLLFLLFHIWQFEGRLWLGELSRADFFAELCASLSSTALGGVPLVALAYLLGVAAASVHAAQGLYHACLSWGVVTPPRRERLGTACLLGGLALFAAGALIVIELATGSVLPSL